MKKLILLVVCVFFTHTTFAQSERDQKIQKVQEKAFAHINRNPFFAERQIIQSFANFLTADHSCNQIQLLRGSSKHTQFCHSFILGHAAGIFILAHGLLPFRFFIGIVQRGAPYNIYNAPVDKRAVAFFSDINEVRATIQGSLADTAFGQFLAPGIKDGSQVDIVFRPQHVRIDFDRAGRGPNPTASQGVAARALVERARFLGSYSLIEFRLETDGARIIATVPSVFLPKAGQAMWLTVPRDRCFVFEAE